MFQHLQERLPRCDGYVALDTHKQGFYKCPNGKIDIAMSLSHQVSCSQVYFASSEAHFAKYIVCLQAYWATLVSAVELKIDLTKAAQYTEALGQVSQNAISVNVSSWHLFTTLYER
jgi:hypothetical protein